MLHKKENTSLTIAIIATIVTAIVFLALFLFLGINHRKDVYADSKQIAQEISRKAAVETEIYLNTALMIARSMEKRSLLVKELGGTREHIKEILKSSLHSNPNFLAAWTLWEPNAFDGKDYLFYTDSLYNDHGTLGIGYFRYNDTVYTEVMTLADYLGPHYLKVKETKRDVVVEPYRFNYSGYKQVFFGTTVSVPIIINNEFVGAFGIDIDLENLQNKLKKIRPYNSGYLCLMSNKGRIVTHYDLSLINKNIFDFLKKNDTLSYYSIVNGSELTIETKSEFTGKKVFRFFYPIKIGRGNEPWSMMVEIPVAEATIRSKQLFYVAIGTLIVGLSLLLYLIINIADRKRYEKEILSAKLKAEESNRLKTAFLNNISHEIRTPLNGILGFSELIINSDINDEQTKVYRDILHNSSNQLLSIISNVIELSKIQACQVEKVIKEFEIEKAIEKVIETNKTALKEKGLRLIQRFPDEKQKMTITSDEDKFKQVLTYLINNSVKFTKEGFVEIGYSKQGNSYTFYVKDTGIGIKPENFNNIFKYFNQEDPTMTRNYGGLGVGLSISKSFVDLLGGSIRFESEYGKGTTFYFYLPNL